MTDQQTRGRAPAHSPEYRTVRYLVRMHARLAAWIVGIMAVVVVLALIIWDRIGVVDQSVVQFARQGVMIWFPFSLGVITATTLLPIHVATGMTRRSFARATLVGAVAMASLYAVALSVLLQLERLAFASLGWEHGISVGSALFTDSAQVGLVAADFFGVTLVGQLAGLLCGIAYYRAGGWWGTLALPLTTGPVFVFLWLAGVRPGSAAFALDLAWRGAFGAAVLIAIATAYSVLVRRAAIAPVRQ